MITKTTTPIIECIRGMAAVVGTKVEYRFLGILLVRKILYMPKRYGVEVYDFQISI